jgi:hypothetical protein
LAVDRYAGPADRAFMPCIDASPSRSTVGVSSIQNTLNGPKVEYAGAAAHPRGVLNSRIAVGHVEAQTPQNRSLRAHSVGDGPEGSVFDKSKWTLRARSTLCSSVNFLRSEIAGLEDRAGRGGPSLRRAQTPDMEERGAGYLTGLRGPFRNKKTPVAVGNYSRPRGWATVGQIVSAARAWPITERCFQSPETSPSMSSR